RGGTGVVFLARELRLDRPVAIKLLAPVQAGDPIARRRFLGEARTAAQLSHPNIVPIFSVDECADVVFFAMAYVDGQTLGQRIREHGPLSPEESARLLREVARALAHAHERGVVHRDVKPDNILLDAATGRALVSEWGTARVGGGTGSPGPWEVVGTADYMSPEQAGGLGVDARSDIYSLGVVGYYALSGRLPFEAPDCYAMLARHITEPPPPLASVAPGVPRRLAQVIDRCLLKEPSARFPSGFHLAVAAGFDRDDLTDALSAELARHREELTFLYGEGASRVERMLRTLTYAGVAVAGLAVTVGLRAPHLAANSILLAVWGAGAGVALLAAVTARACMEHRTDLRRERRLRFWDGPLG